VQSVARKAAELGRKLGSDDVLLLVSAAWLHDIGYAPGIVDTGLHSLDGARWLRRNGFSDRLASLVAYHSCATYEAEERGLAGILEREFVREHSAVSDALWFADMTTGPDGSSVTVEERLAEIGTRYGPDDPVTRFWRRARPELVAAIRRTEEALVDHPM
jgi:hypothetical protein